MFRPMRRTRQQLSDSEAEQILRNGTTGVLAVNGDDGYPYAVPVNYVYTRGRILFHGAKEGYKYDAMKRQEKVCFCVIGKDEICAEKLTDLYQSVIVFGRVHLLEGQALQEAAYELGMRFLPDAQKVQMEIESELPRLACFELLPEHITGKEGKDLAFLHR